MIVHRPALAESSRGAPSIRTFAPRGLPLAWIVFEASVPSRTVPSRESIQTSAESGLERSWLYSMSQPVICRLRTSLRMTLIPACLAETDVAAGDDRLVQIDPVEIDADRPGSAVIDVRVGQEHVAVALDQVDAVAALADRDSGDRRLHRPIELDAVGLVVVADDLEVADGRQAWRCQTRGSMVAGSADLKWVPTKRTAGPGPSMCKLAVTPCRRPARSARRGRGRSPAGRSGGKSRGGRQAVPRPDPRHAEAPWCRRSGRRRRPRNPGRYSWCRSRVSRP